jgi:hypothetical protein
MHQIMRRGYWARTRAAAWFPGDSLDEPNNGVVDHGLINLHKINVLTLVFRGASTLTRAE